MNATWKAWSDHPYIVTLGLVLAVTSIGATIWFGLAGLDRAATPSVLAVRVADTTGASISNAKVLLFHSEGAQSQTTDADGVSAFSFDTAAREGMRVIAEARGYGIQEQKIEHGEEGPIVFNLEQQAGDETNFIFRTMDASEDTPVPFAEIALIAEGQVFRKVTDSDGFASFTLALSEEAGLVARVSVSAEGYRIEDQESTILPETLQYILLSPTSLTLEVPSIPTAVAASADIEGDSLPESSSEGVERGTNDAEVGSGLVREELQNGAGLRIILQDPDGGPWGGGYIVVYEQIPDVAGNPSRGERIGDGRISAQGQLDLELDEGVYAVCPDQAPGYGWTSNDCIYNVEVTPERLSVIRLQPGKLEVAIVGATGEPWRDVYYEIYTQRNDVSGNPVTDQRVTNGRTDNRGLGSKWLTPGLYTVLFNLRGYNWGNAPNAKGQLDVPIRKGATERISIEMGRLLIGLRRPSGEPNNDVYIAVHTQRTDVNGQPLRADPVWDGRTDAAGFATVDLTAGTYALQIADDVLYDIPIEWGKITETDGETVAAPQEDS